MISNVHKKCHIDQALSSSAGQFHLSDSPLGSSLSGGLCSGLCSGLCGILSRGRGFLDLLDLCLLNFDATPAKRMDN